MAAWTGAGAEPSGPRFAAHGWTFRADPRRAPEFLQAAKEGGTLVLEGSGRTTYWTTRTITFR